MYRKKMSNNAQLAAEYIHNSDAILVTAGAGIGVDSGLPDFRGNEGFWKAYPPIAKLGISFYEMANPEWFRKDPKLAWAFYGHRLNLYRTTSPHAGFYQLLEQAKHKRDGYFVFTSNVDGQFQKAGFSDDFIEECHGSIHHFQCCNPCTDNIWSAADIDIKVDLDTFKAFDPLPLCPNCGGLARPNILMFGDWEWISHRTSTQENRLKLWLENLTEIDSKLVIIEIGAGNAVPTVRHLSENIASRLNAKLIRINPRDTQVPQGHISIPENAAKGIDNILGN
jgi:NAD-dependent SIR2 family protein deacetylase